jgi:uncharacterized protein with PIN domain
VEGRLEHGFRARFRALASTRGSPDPGKEAERLIEEAHAIATHGAAQARVLAALWAREASQARKASMGLAEAAMAGHPPRFLCDPSLAGLARWLRAAGFETDVAVGIAGHRLPDEALRTGRVLLTTDAEVLDRRIVVDGRLSVVWVPSALTMREQLRMVMLDLGLTLEKPRCMRCGGALVKAAKQAVRSRIPPRTALWKDEYFVCASCDGLFWQGTHWERIARTLAEALEP